MLTFIAPLIRFSRWVANTPLPLLILTGTLLGSMLPMASLARGAGWSPLAFAFWPALGSGLLLAASGWWAVGRAGGSGISLRLLIYSIAGGALSVAIPNAVTFIVMQELGTSLTSLMYTLPPLFTYAIAWLAGVEPYRPLRFAGIVLGLCGAGLLVLSRTMIATGSAWWIMAALCAPLSLAAGNVYRKQAMPTRVDSRLLAGGMLLGGALLLFPFLAANGTTVATMAADAGGGLFSPGLSGWHIIAVQCVLTTVGYLVYFRFQKIADAVYFSQIGYVISATGVFSGILFFHERLTGLMLLAVLTIVAGIVMVNRRTAQAHA